MKKEFFCAKAAENPASGAQPPRPNRAPSARRKDADGAKPSFHPDGEGKQPFATKKRASTSRAKNEVILEVGRFDDSFRGVAYLGAARYAVSGALPKEKVSAAVIKTENNVQYAEVRQVLEASPERVTPSCPYYDRCGGCHLLHIAYPEELRYKTALVKKKLFQFKFFKVDECISAGGEGCRNKVHLAFWKRPNGLDIGFFDETTHRVIDVPQCLMHGEWYPNLVSILREWVTEFDISVYDPKTSKGALRFAAARYLDGGLLLTIVSAVPTIGRLDELYNMLRVRFKKVSLWKNVNSERTNEVMAGKLRFVAGEKRLEGELLGVRFGLSPNTFFQVNEKVASSVYQRVIDLIRESGAETVVDAYSGIGITSALFAKAGLKVVSVEIVEDAVRDAKALFAANGITGVEAIAGDCKDVLPALRLSGKTAFFVDPPRAGLGEDVANAVADFAPSLILYLSCNPATLAADLGTLLSRDYALLSATPYDMFPHSRHLETLVCMTLK